jgi:peroxiredoxin
MPSTKNKGQKAMDNVNRLRVGLIAPGIFLHDSEGKKVDSSSLLGKNKLVVVFYKADNDSLDWLEELNKSSDKIELSNGLILAISPQGPRGMEEFKQKRGLNFPLLYDRKSETIAAYSVLDTSSEKGEPHPATFVVDRLGIIRYRKVYADYKDKPTAKEIVSFLEEVT